METLKTRKHREETRGVETHGANTAETNECDNTGKAKLNTMNMDRETSKIKQMT